jgi:predicted metal-dependent HD superfamily phosphohydrolase
VSPTAERFVALCRRLGASGDAAPLAADLLGRWREPGRVYHNVEHLGECLGHLDTAPGSADRDLVEAALWFHDAVYDPRSAENEARSAGLARQALTGLGVPDETGVRVAELVLLTRHRDPPATPEGRLLCDIDLAVLGGTDDEFDRYDRAIRREYSRVPEPVYRRERAAVLNALLRRDPLYATSYFRERYEAAARANLRRALARLSDP